MRQGLRGAGDQRIAQVEGLRRGDQRGDETAGLHGVRKQKRQSGVKRRALLIAGPTASGKSAVALALARRFSATIVNADSMQVYRDLRTLTARPSQSDEAAAPHALFGVIDGAINHSVGLWLAEARDAAAQVFADGRPVLFVGGSGLY